MIPDRLLGQGVNQFVHPADRGKAISGTMATANPGDRAWTQLRLIRPDGATIWVETVVRAQPSPTGDGLTLISSSRDVTRQVEAEMKLRDAKQELDALLAETDGVLYRSIADADGSPLVTFISDSVEGMTGFTAKEATAPKWFETNLDPAFRSALSVYVRRLRQTGTASITYRFRHKDGHWIWVSLTGRREIGPGEAAVTVGFAQDVTRHHEMDMQLTQAAKLAVLGEMTTGLAHELNQPLTTIGMSAENALALLATPGYSEPALKAKLERIQRQAVRAGELIKRMRIFGTKNDGAPVRIDLAAAISAATEVAAGRLQQARATLAVQIEPGLPSIVANDGVLEQVLVNLIGNAADAVEVHLPPLPADKRVIRMTVTYTEDSLRIRVSDQAGGIDPAVLPRVFEPFFTTKPVGSGTGLGLSISYGIITDMGGTIAAANENGGAVFDIHLPPALAPAAESGVIVPRRP